MTHLSIVPHVKSDMLISLEERLHGISKLSVDFLVLLSLSMTIATLGLFLNSPAVVIGAMIIAPLMRPLSGLSLACLTADTPLLRTAVIALCGGTVCGVVIAYFLGLCLQTIVLGPEILARTHPNLLDLGVAMAAGAVASYCQARQHMLDTLAGVAIAVALVPPLSVVGIGLAAHSVPVWSGAALLYATNLVGISVAGALMFFLMGYTPLHQAKKGLAITVIFLSILTIPLGFSMRELILENQLTRQINRILKEQTYTFKAVKLQGVEVKRFQNPTRVTATVFALQENITPRQVRLVQEFLSRETGIPIEFRLRIVPVTEVTSVEITPLNVTTTTVPVVNPPDKHIPTAHPVSPTKDLPVTPSEDIPSGASSRPAQLETLSPTDQEQVHAGISTGAPDPSDNPPELNTKTLRTH